MCVATNFFSIKIFATAATVRIPGTMPSKVTCSKRALFPCDHGSCHRFWSVASRESWSRLLGCSQLMPLDQNTWKHDRKLIFRFGDTVKEVRELILMNGPGPETMLCSNIPLDSDQFYSITFSSTCQG